MFDNLFNPKSIAVVGASSNVLKPGGSVLQKIKDHGFMGDLWPVNPGSDTVQGLPAFKSIDDLPGCPDLAFVAIPAPGVRAALEDLGRIGVKATIILSAGFGEVDEKGKEEEKKLLEIAGKTDMTLIGPNCSGFLTPTYAGKFAGIVPVFKTGTIDFISGSGATVDWVIEQATTRGLSFSSVVNMGNSIQVSVEDILALFDENYGPNSGRILLLYLEQVKKPEKLLRHARSLTSKGCAVVGIKSGVTEAGARAAASHVGAMATSETAVQALFDKAGIIRVESRMALVDVACVLSANHGPIEGNRACIVTEAGGPGVMLSDELNRQGFELPPLGERTRRRLSEFLPAESSVANPIDCLPGRDAEQVREIIEVLEEEEKGNIDVILMLMGNSGLSNTWNMYQVIMEAIDGCSIPIVPVLSSVSTCADLIEKFRNDGKFYFFDEVPAGTALGKIVQRPVLYEPLLALEDYDRDGIKDALHSQGDVLDPGAVKDVLTAAGFNLPLQFEVFDKNDLPSAYKEVGFPLVMKAIGPLHKSDVGGVRTGINSFEEAERVWRSFANIKGVSGVLVQKMVPGIEVILGAKREAGFGHLIMFGLGGIYTEVLKDISFALAPLAKEEGLRMIQGIKALPILKGVRGEKGVSLDLLSEYLVRLSLLVTDFPQIEEIDLNPVKGFESELYVVDARIIQRA